MAAIFDELTEYIVENAEGRTSQIGNLPYRFIGFYFTASWCGVCNNIFPKLRSTYTKINEIEKHLEIVNINLESTEEDADAVTNKYPWWSLPFNEYRNGYLSQMFNVQFIPQMFVFNREGEMVSNRGFRDML